MSIGPGRDDDSSGRGDGPPPLTGRELKAVMRYVAQCVRKPDVGALLEQVGALDPLPDEPKRKRIAAALIQTQQLEGHGGIVERITAAADAYDDAAYTQDVKRAAEHVVGHDRITVVGQAQAMPEDRFGHQVQPPGDAAFVALTHWGGSTDGLPRSIVLLVKEGSRETQVELDADGAGQLIAALTEARRIKSDGDQYLRKKGQPRQ